VIEQCPRPCAPSLRLPIPAPSVPVPAPLLAAEHHRRKAGDQPPSIAAIDRIILPIAPVDPFSGRSFRMERRDGELFNDSIGPNREDEPGAYDPKKWMKGGLDDAGASVWDVPMRRRPARPIDAPSSAESDRAE
jgi:hypothetical protein